ncbi:uncharacterized protein LOC118757367 [Rhagoletis pomonella]|uniref:uncharacterized protein LOC118757367 n=1 Tax=Rhagoletis pomonella TaxID=28610 RepID=UPI0017832608|nr:uncharacterized protein LOC118757367 [Rhagoletis pomonella]
MVEDTVELQSKESDSWYVDSAATKHMTFHREWFSTLRKYTTGSKVKVANNSYLQIEAIGTILIDVKVDNQWKPVRLENVLYVPELSENLLSTSMITDRGITVIIDKEGCKFVDQSNEVVAVGKRNALNQLKINFRLHIDEYANLAAVSLEHWHRRLGHVHVDAIKQMCKEYKS